MADVNWDGLQPAIHYHIQWSGKDTLDWERFDTRSTAAESAQRLARYGETFTIHERREDCARCASVRAKSASSSYDIFEMIRDAPIWRASVKDHDAAISKMRDLALVSNNQFQVMHMPTNAVVAVIAARKSI